MVVQHGYIQNLQSWAVYNKYAKHNLVSKLNWLRICFSRPRDWKVWEVKTLKIQVHNANSDFIDTKKREKNRWDQRSPGFSKESWNHKPGTVQKLEPNNTENLFPLSYGRCLSMQLEIGLHIIAFRYYSGEMKAYFERVKFCSDVWMLQVLLLGSFAPTNVIPEVLFHVSSEYFWIGLQWALLIPSKRQSWDHGKLFLTCLHLSTIGHLSPLPFIGTVHSE
jgi:hypothetical protein